MTAKRFSVLAILLSLCAGGCDPAAPNTANTNDNGNANDNAADVECINDSDCAADEDCANGTCVLIDDGGAAKVINLSLPSESTGDSSAPLGVRIHVPAEAEARYPEGAPVMVMLAGGHGAATEENDNEEGVLAAQAFGYVHVSFAMPGTLKAGTEGGSGGVYDYRGLLCQRALADVVLFAMGELPDSDGRTITDHVSFALTDNVGVAAFSNGGNLALTALAAHADELADLAWLVFWESPVGDQYVGGELGAGRGADATFNPFYVPGTSTLTSCPWPGMGDVLAYDPAGTFLLEDPADSEKFTLTGVFYLDENGNAVADEDEFAFHPVGGPGDEIGGNHMPKGYVSVELATLIDEHADDLFTTGRPPWLATLEEVGAYAADRDGSLAVDDVVAAWPDMPMIMVARTADHVQSQPDHPHVRMLVNSWGEFGGTYARLNPDSDYMAEVTGLAASNFPDNTPNQSIPYPGIEAMLEPTTVDGTPMSGSSAVTAAILELADRVRGVVPVDEPGSDGITYVDSDGIGREATRRAAVIEMADRVQFDTWDDDLDAVLAD